MFPLWKPLTLRDVETFKHLSIANQLPRIRVLKNTILGSEFGGAIHIIGKFADRQKITV